MLQSDQFLSWDHQGKQVLSNKSNFSFAEIIECGSVVNNSLTSPGYPNNYPPNMDCNYSVPIPHGLAIKINFHKFDVEYDLKCK